MFLEGSMKRKRLKNRLKRQIIRRDGKKMVKVNPQKSGPNPFNDLGFWFWLAGLDFPRFFGLGTDHNEEQTSYKENN
jgi:hypothetical protein